MQNERNMKCCRSTWNQQNNSSIHFRACWGMGFGFMLDLEHADFIWFPQNPGKQTGPPQKDNHNSNYSDVKEFDGSYICFPYFSIFPICLHIFPWCVLYFPIFPLKNPCHFPALVLQAGPSPRCNCAVCPSLRPQPGRSGRWRRLTCETRRGGIREGWMGSVSSKGM